MRVLVEFIEYKSLLNPKDNLRTYMEIKSSKGLENLINQINSNKIRIIHTKL